MMSKKMRVLLEKVERLEEEVTSWQRICAEQGRQIELLRQANADVIEKTESDLSNLNRHIDNVSVALKARTETQSQEMKRKTEALTQEISRLRGELDSTNERSKRRYSQSVRNDEIMKEGYDFLIAKLKLATIEQRVPGNARRLKELQNTHKGERCFVIGNGPSLKAKDLDVLKKNHIFSFASNRISVIFPETEWRPDVWSCIDINYNTHFPNEGEKYANGLIFLADEAILEYNILFENAAYVPYISTYRSPREFNTDIMLGTHNYKTITGNLLNFAVYMGFSEIYLLGVDNRFPTKIQNGMIQPDFSKQAHFSDAYVSPEVMSTYNVYGTELDLIKRMDIVSESYEAIKNKCDQLGVNIYNATRGGALEVFPRVDFDKIDW